MAFVALDIPPGVVQRGTPYSARGRWGAANLWRFRAGSMMPVGGWQPRSSQALPSGRGRATLTWRDNSNTAWIAVGSETGLFIQDRSGDLYTITPSPFTAGRPDAITGGGYGSGAYGSGPYGQPTADATQIQDATMWSLDTFGPYLVGVSSDDGNLVEWQLSTSTAAAKIANSPPCVACFTTGEHMIAALGSNNDPRQITVSDQSDNTQWTASNTNTSRQFELATQGRLMCGKRIQGSNLVWTDIDVWQMTIQQNQLIYGFSKAGDGCGIISRGAAVVVSSQAVWMGPRGFYAFNGVTTEPLPCDVQDGVFSNINMLQASKVVAFFNSQFDEVWWLYPSAGSNEVDSYVAWNVHENTWTVGKLARASACDRGVLTTPLMVGFDGLVYEHETGLNWGGALPFVTLSNFEIGDGDKVFLARQLIADDRVVGQVSAAFAARFYPDAPSYAYGPYSLSPRTDVLFTGREVDMILQATGSNDFRVGRLRLEGTTAGAR